MDLAILDPISAQHRFPPMIVEEYDLAMLSRLSWPEDNNIAIADGGSHELPRVHQAKTLMR